MKNLVRLVIKNPYLIVGLGVLVIFWISNLFGSKSNPRMDIDYSGSKLSDAQALSKADALHTAMKNPGTDENAVYEALKGLTMYDFNKVYKFFGNRVYNTWMGVTGGWLAGDSERDLIYWLSNELSDSEKNELMRINPHLTIF